MIPKLLTADETAAILRTSRAMVYQMVAARRIACVRIGRKVLFDSEVVEKYLAAHVVPAKPT